MKKISLILVGLISSLTAFGREMDFEGDSYMIRAILSGAAAIFLAYLVGLFVLAFLKRILDYRLRKKVIEMGGSEAMLSSLLQPSTKNEKNAVMKSAVVLAGIGLGLLLVNLFPPFGVHSLMILAFCTSLSFLVYYFLLQKISK